ncbi:MAG: hypothetical protein J3T61_12065, partial [Candidatus Brocadiales bacterium]|nr:hypothetical protein [Candidatus Bathyanammoxibius sp.]
EGDFEQMRAAALNVPSFESFVPTFGPTADALSDASTLFTKIREGESIEFFTDRFGFKDPKQIAGLINVISVPLARGIRAASEQLEAGGSAKDLVQAVIGLPTSDAIIRSQVLRLAELGRTTTIKDLLQEYSRARGGHLPLNFSAIRRRKDEFTKKTRTRQKVQSVETLFEKNRRRFRGRTEETLRNPTLRIETQGIF